VTAAEQHAALTGNSSQQLIAKKLDLLADTSSRRQIAKLALLLDTDPVRRLTAAVLARKGALARV
jgi:hypothetical protein